MREQIKELAKQAGFEYDPRDCNFYSPEGGSQWINNEIYKFAELIIKECINQINNMKVDIDENIYSSPDNIIDCVNERIEDICGNIEEHFGVK